MSATISPAAAERRSRLTDSQSVRQFRFWLTFQRRTLRGTVASALLGPALYLTAMGLGLGSLVNREHTLPGGGGFLVFVAPGILAATAMQTAFGDATYPVLGAIKWAGNYWAAIATPQRPAQVLRGHALFVLARITLITGFFLGVAAAFGAVSGWEGLLAWPAAVLTGAAFTLPIMAYVITLDTETTLSNLFRFVMTPLFLFSGTFFPWRQLPHWAYPVAFATPLWHGTELCRSLTLGTATWGSAAIHVAYLAVLATAGLLAGQLTYRRRLYV
ncbi:MAG TPA: ABC transporter permease [Actinocrinis sp.]|nr:ABC transporter permease [Actinocrinis sp.]